MAEDGHQDGTGSGSSVIISVPGQDIYLQLLRMVIGRVARLAGFSFDGVEDLALAVSECAVLLLEGKPESIQMVARHDSPVLTIHLAANVTDGSWPPSGLSETTRWLVVEALCESIELRAHAPVGMTLRQTSR